MEDRPTEEGLVQRHYLLIMTLAMAGVAVVGIITMQLLAAALVIVLIIGCILIIRYLGKFRKQNTSTTGNPETLDEGSVVIAAALFAFAGMAISVWIVWAIALALLILIYRSLTRIERHLERAAAPVHQGEG